MKTNKFSIIEMMVVLLIITILMAMAYPFLRDAKVKQMKVTTRNMINQQKAMVSAYFSDYGLLPDPGHVAYGQPPPIVNYSDATSVEYWKRASKDLRQLNPVTKKNAELIWEYLNNDEGGSIETYNDFTVKFPTRDLIISLDPWQVNAATTIPFFKKEQVEEVRAIAHSSKFLNYYLSGSGFDVSKSDSYVKNEEKWLANDDTTYRLSWERSVQVKPWVFLKTKDFIAWDGGYTSGWGGRYNSGTEIQLSSIPPVTSYLLNGKSLNYFDYLPKIITMGAGQAMSKNYAEDLNRRLYVFNDTKVVQMTDAYTPKKSSLGSDRMIYNPGFFNNTKLKDESGGANTPQSLLVTAQAKLAASKAKLAADITAGAVQAVLDADQLAIDNDQIAVNTAQSNFDASIAAIKNTGGELRNENACIFMRAHKDNVKSIVDAFNSPIVYITYMNQRVDSAKTYKETDPAKVDKSMRSDSFIIYSLGANKADDSDMGENYMNRQKTGDDIIEMSGGK